MNSETEVLGLHKNEKYKENGNKIPLGSVETKYELTLTQLHKNNMCDDISSQRLFDQKSLYESIKATKLLFIWLCQKFNILSRSFDYLVKTENLLGFMLLPHIKHR